MARKPGHPRLTGHLDHELLRGLAASDQRTKTGTIPLLLAREAAVRGIVR